MSRSKQLSLLYILPLIAVIFSLVTKANTLGSLFLFWGVPSLLLTFWARKHAPKASVFAAIATVFLIALNIIFYTTQQWYVVSMFDSRILGIMAWEDIPYFFLFVYFPVIFWEHLYDSKGSKSGWGKRMSILASVFILASLAILSAHLWFPEIIAIPYFYFIGLVILIVIPLLIEVFSHPKLGFKFLRVGLYFAYVGILYELTALYLGQWYFPSDKFFGWIEIVGLKFPIEEFFAWMILGASAILSWYEYFDDDNR